MSIASLHASIELLLQIQIEEFTSRIRIIESH